MQSAYTVESALKAAKLGDHILVYPGTYSETFVVDKNIAPDEVDKLLKLFASYSPLTMNVDYAINFDKFGMDGNEEHDLSGVSIETAIDEFVNLLDVDDKKA